MDVFAEARKGNISSVLQYIKTHPKAAVASGPDGNTLLHCAALSDEGDALELVEWLVDNGADVKASNQQGATPLHMVALGGLWEVADVLLDHGARVDAKVNAEGAAEEASRSVDNYACSVIGATPLHFAAGNPADDESLVSLFLEHGADVNSKTADGTTPLFLAVDKENECVAERLVKAGAEVNVAHEGLVGWTPLMIATFRGNVDLVRLLARNGANVNLLSREAGAAVHIAVFNGDSDLVNALVDLGADLNARNPDGVTPLEIALCQGYDELIRTLAAHGADVNAVSHDRTSPPLALAIMGDQIVAVAALIECGADVNALADGLTPLYLAVSQGNDAVMMLLLENGADPNMKLPNGRTPMDIAQSEAALAVMRTFAKHKGAAGPGCSSAVLLIAAAGALIWHLI